MQNKNTDYPEIWRSAQHRRTQDLSGWLGHTPASVAAFIEYAFQEALALIEQNKPVVFALAKALIDHPERTLNGAEVDQCIADTLNREAMKIKVERSARWRAVEMNVADFVAEQTKEN
jgi:hypothetical protein